MLLLVFLCGFKELHAFSVTGSFIQRAREYFFHWSFPRAFSIYAVSNLEISATQLPRKKSLLTVVSRPSAALRSAERSARRCDFIKRESVFLKQNKRGATEEELLLCQEKKMSAQRPQCASVPRHTNRREEGVVKKNNNLVNHN